MRSASIIRFLMLVMLALLPNIVQAQTGQSVVLFRGIRGVDNTTTSGELLIISLDDASVQTVPLPPRLFPANLGDVALSPDRRYLALASETIRIVDLQTNSWVEVSPPILNVDAYELGAFSPDSARLAFSWVGSVESGGFPFTGGIMIVNAAAGTPLQSVLMADIAAAYPDVIPAASPWALLGEWNTDGIRFSPFCYACDAFPAGVWHIWSPDTNTFIVDTGEYFDQFFADPLAGTGEMLFAAQDPRFPMDPGEGFFPIPNVITYVAPKSSLDGLPGTVIYFNPDQIDLSGGAHWVQDGNAALITPFNGADWTLLHRDGSQQNVSFAAESRLSFLTGTPRGWLAQINDPEWNTILFATVEGAEIMPMSLPLVLGNDDRILVLDAPVLGTSIVSPGSFPAVEPSSPPVTSPGMCPNLLPTRLSVNTTARITPGASNRLRSDPSTGGAVVGQIPGSAQIAVIGGPVCDDANSIVWWQVNYNGIVGWTAESLGDSYFIEPVGAG